MILLSSSNPTSGKRGEKDEVCPHCDSENVEYEQGKLVCKNCGSILENNVVSPEPDKRFYSYEEAVKEGKHSRTSQATPKTKTDRKNLGLSISLIKNLVNKLHLPYFVRQEAINLYKEVMVRKLLRKDRVPAISAALVYLVCRKSRISLPLERVSEESEIEKSEIIKSYMEIIELLKIEVNPPSIEGLAILFAKKGGFKPETIALARKIANKLKDEYINIGKDPNGIAAAAVYAAAKRKDEEVTQKEIAKIASITEVTVRNRFVEVEKTLSQFEI